MIKSIIGFVAVLIWGTFCTAILPSPGDLFFSLVGGLCIFIKLR